MNALKYLRDQLNDQGDFMMEFRKLDKKDKDELREASVAEMNALGIEIDA